MRSRTSPRPLAIVAAFTLALPTPAGAQILEKVKKTAENAAARETAAQIDRLVRNAIRCLVDDPVCPEAAGGADEEVIFVDEEGEIITDEEGVPITDREQALARTRSEGGDATFSSFPADRTYWRLRADGDTIEGTVAYVSVGDRRLFLHLVNRAAVNFHLVLPGEAAADGPVELALLSVGRGQACRLVPSDPPFRVRFERSEGPWLRGSYAGTLGCEDDATLPVSGTFQVENPESLP